MNAAGTGEGEALLVLQSVHGEDGEGEVGEGIPSAPHAEGKPAAPSPPPVARLYEPSTVGSPGGLAKEAPPVRKRKLGKPKTSVVPHPL